MARGLEAKDRMDAGVPVVMEQGVRVVAPVVDDNVVALKGV